MTGLVAFVEHVVKKPLFDCRMCGQCVLHSTGMTCPMTCPKTLRNGPCGGVREDGGCEVKPDMTCVWLVAERRSTSLPLPRVWRDGIDHLRPPVDNTLQGTSSWVNLVTGRDRQNPLGWELDPAKPALVEDEPDGPGWSHAGSALVEVDDLLMDRGA
ncbi:MAG: methylenetetrahydrofolate reductase C-terminal domain-containing protein [Candidatus Nanopelagicales bacterium]